jgi:hypothetical protein
MWPPFGGERVASVSLPRDEAIVKHLTSQIRGDRQFEREPRL